MKTYTSDADIADINGDGYVDVVVPICQGKEGWIYWFENPDGRKDAEWKYHEVAHFPGHSYHFADVLTEDPDNDGKVDIVTRDLGDAQLKDATIPDMHLKIYIQDAPDSWTTKVMSTHPRGGTILHDVDVDGRLDIVCNGFWYKTPPDIINGSYTEYSIDEDHYKQTMLPQNPDKWNNSAKVATADINEDGRMDLVLATSEGDVGYIAWYPCPSDPTNVSSWPKHKIQDIQNCHQLYCGDIDLDRDMDIFGGMFRMSGFQLYKGVFIWYNNNQGDSWTKQTVSDNGIYQGVLLDAGDAVDLDIMGTDGFRSSPLYWYRNELDPLSGASVESAKDIVVREGFPPLKKIFFFLILGFVVLRSKRKG